MSRAKPKPGQLCCFEVDGNEAIIQYVGTHTEFGDVIRVVGLGPLPADESERCKYLSSGFLVCYPLRAAIRQGLVASCGEGPVPEVPTVFIRSGLRDRSGRPLNWIVGDGINDRVVEAVVGNDRNLPLAQIWNHQALIGRVREHWKPFVENPGMSETKDPVPGGNQATHFLYSSARDTIERAARRILEVWKRPRDP